MPIYDGDLEANHGLPEAAKAFKQLLLAHDGVLVATPEYNSYFPALLKNALDWASRREGNEPPLVVFKDKVAGVMSASPGALAGLRGQAALRAQLSYLGMLVVPDRLGIGAARDAFDPQGRLKDARQHEAALALGARTAVFARRVSAS
jgi:NAD(P)H-dependent FMN reductase